MLATCLLRFKMDAVPTPALIAHSSGLSCQRQPGAARRGNASYPPQQSRRIREGNPALVGGPPGAATAIGDGQWWGPSPIAPAPSLPPGNGVYLPSDPPVSYAGCFFFCSRLSGLPRDGRREYGNRTGRMDPFQMPGLWISQWEWWRKGMERWPGATVAYKSTP